MLLPRALVLLSVLVVVVVVLLQASLVVLVLRVAVQLVVVALLTSAMLTLLHTWQQHVEHPLSVHDEAWSQAHVMLRHRRLQQQLQLFAGHVNGQAKTTINSASNAASDAIPEPMATSLASFVRALVRDYIQYWFTPISPDDNAFPEDVTALLSEIVATLIARVRQVEALEYLQVSSVWVDVARVHLGWFREVFAQLAEEQPEVFQSGVDEQDDDAKLAQRQALVAAHVQQATYLQLHPACLASESTLVRKTRTTASKSDPNERSDKASTATPNTIEKDSTALYLRHVATQLLMQLHPELKQSQTQRPTSAFAPMLLHLLREIVAFRVLEPLLEYTWPRYANEVVAASLQALDETADTVSGGTGGATAAVMAQLKPFTPIKSIQSTGRFLYRASKRSSEQAEAALQAVLEVVSSAATTTAATAPTTLPSTQSPTFQDDKTANMDGHRFFPDVLLSPSNRSHDSGSGSGSDDLVLSPSSTTTERKSSNFASFGTRFKPSRFLPQASSPSIGPAQPLTTAMRARDEMKAVKASFGSGLNASLGKVKRTIGGIGDQLRDPFPIPLAAAAASATTAQAAKISKMPGKFFQKALGRGTVDAEPNGPISPSSLQDNAQPLAHQETAEQVLQVLDTAAANYAGLCHDHPELQSSPRTHELLELMAALEDVLMLGYHRPTTLHRGSVESDHSGSEYGAAAIERDPLQLYWNYLSQDRPETPFLNEHWRFVAMSCPACRDSEAFYSSRGLQWLLLALEKGLLWEFFTALSFCQDLTAQFYDDTAIMRSNDRLDVLRQSLLHLNKVQVVLDLHEVLGRESPTSTTPKDTNQTQTEVVDAAWEIEHLLPRQGWTTMPDGRSDALPSSEWVWATDWTLERQDDAVVKFTWEYAKSLDAKFHEQDTKQDTVRRRKWIRRRRRLPPVLAVREIVDEPLISGDPSCASAGVDTMANATDSAIDAEELSRFSLNGTASAVVKPASAPPSPQTRCASLSSPRLPAQPVEHDDHYSESDSIAVNQQQPVQAHQQPQHHTSLVQRLRTRPSFRLRRSGTSKRQLQDKNADVTTNVGEHSNPFSPIHDSMTEETNDETEDHNVHEHEQVTGVNAQWCTRCLAPLVDAQSPRHSSTSRCQSCLDPLCRSCPPVFAFLVYPPIDPTAVKQRVCYDCFDRLTKQSRFSIEVKIAAFTNLIEPTKTELSSVQADVLSPTTRSSADSSASSSPRSRSFSLSFSLSPSMRPLSPLPVAVPAHKTVASGEWVVELQCRRQQSQQADHQTTMPDSWRVVKSMNDFLELERQLLEQRQLQEKCFGTINGQARQYSSRHHHLEHVDYTELDDFVESRSALHDVATDKTLASDARINILQSFLNQLLQCATLGQSTSVQTFFAVPLSNLALNASEDVEPLKPTTKSKTTTDKLKVTDKPSTAKTSATASAATASTSTQSSPKKARVRVLQSLEISLFAVLHEIFEMDGMGLVRRNLVALTRSFLKAFVNASHFRKLERTMLSFTEPTQVAAALDQLHESLFPDNVDPATTTPTTPPAPLSAAAMQQLRKNSREALLANTPSVLVSLWGETACANAALKLHEFLQHEVFVKSLVCSMVDVLLATMFPEVAPFDRHLLDDTTSATQKRRNSG